MIKKEKGEKGASFGGLRAAGIEENVKLITLAFRAYILGLTSSITNYENLDSELLFPHR